MNNTLCCQNLIKPKTRCHSFLFTDPFLSFIFFPPIISFHGCHTVIKIKWCIFIFYIRLKLKKRSDWKFVVWNKRWSNMKEIFEELMLFHSMYKRRKKNNKEITMVLSMYNLSFCYFFSSKKKKKKPTLGNTITSAHDWISYLGIWIANENYYVIFLSEK